MAAAGVPTREIDDLFQAVDSAAEDQLQLTVIHATEERTVTVRLG